MTKIKRLVAVAMAFLMILGSLSMAAFAWDANTDDGFTLGIATKFYRNVEGEWVETTKVEQGEQIKARVYLSTDYYTNSGNLLFFYNSSFLEGNFLEGNNTLVVNPYYASYPYTITGAFNGENSASNVENALVKRNAITQDFADAHDFIHVRYQFDGTSYNQKFNGSKWFCEFDFTVKADASTADQGNLFALESTMASPSFTRGVIDIPKGEYNKKNASTVSMTSWNAKLVMDESPVTLYTNKVAVTFNANGGLFDDDSEVLYYEGEAGAELAPAAPSRPKYTFKGWAIKGTEDIVDATAYPAGDTEYVAIWESNTASDGEAVDFETRFYRNIGTEEEPNWVYTEKAQRGEVLKARIFINTNYYTNAGDIIVFYNNKFFTDTYASNVKLALDVNDEAGSAVANNIYGEFVKYNSNNNEIQKLVKNGYISAGFADQHNAYAINYIFNPSVGKKLTVNDWSTESNEWLFEFDVQVTATASGMEYFWIEENTIMNPDDGIYAFINVPVSTENGDNTKVIALHSINVDKTIDNGFVELDSTLTFDANEGVFDGGKEELVISNHIGAAIVAPKDPTRDGYTFMGWADEDGNIVAVPEEMPYEETVLTAVWQANVDISYDTDGDGVADVTETVTSGAEFVKPADPSKEGNRFVGWSSDPTGAVITGLPAEYPAEDTTYTAIFDPLSYEVNYFVRDPETLEFKLVSEVPIPYGELIAHAPSTAYKAPEGYSLSDAYSNASLTTLLADDATMPASAVDVYFKLVPNTYTATFDAAEGAWADGASTKTVDAVYNTQIVAPEDPTREGFTFIGWNPDVDIMDDIDGEYFYAVWEENTYYATYIVDDAEYQVYDHVMGQVIDVPADPYKEGYNFIGWTNYTEGMTMPAEDVEFIAVFEAIEYTATFDANGGTFAENGKDEIVLTLATDAELAAPADPVREGYTFSGWDPIVPETMTAGDATYTATWSANTDTPYTVEIYTMDTAGDYGTPVVQNKTGVTGSIAEITTNAGVGMYVDETESILSAEILPDGSTVLKVYYARDAVKVTFDANGGKLEGDAEEIVLDLFYGATVATPADPVLVGNTFKGWAPAVVNKAIEDATYVAQWEANEYTITFDTDGGEEIAPIVDKFGAEIDAPADPAKEGYTFTGWVDAEGNAADIPETMPAEDVALKATWEINKYDISINADGGKLADGNETYAATDVDYATDLEAYGVPMAEPTKEGYTFAGWVDADGNATELPATMPAGDVNITAAWEINEHSITFDTDGGSAIDPITGDYGDAITAPADPTKEGYTFTGWVDADGNAADIPATMPDEDVALKATWAVNSYKVVYTSDEETFADYDVNYGAAIPVPAVPTKTGYTFGGWYEKNSGKANTDYTSMPAENLEFVAKWNSVQGVEYYFDVYKMGVDGEYPATPERSVLTGEVGAEVSVQYTAATGFKLDSYKLSGTIEPTGTLVLYAYVAREEYKFTAYKEIGSTEVIAEGTYLYEAPVTAVADPTNTGYVFDGWVDADGATAKVPASMPAKDVTIYATWLKDAFNASFDAGEGATFPNGDQVVTDPTELDAPIKAPAEDPVKDGYEFIGWAPADDPDNVITDGNFGNMDADGEEFVAVWEKATYKVTFYDYVPEDGKTPMVKSKVASAEYDYEAKIIFPAEVNLYEYEHYTFLGWTLVENKPIVTEDYTEEMLAELLVDTSSEIADVANANEDGEINYYAVYKRVKVMLIPKNDECTTVIDRDGGTVDDYVDGESIWYVYGLEEILKETTLLAEYIDVQGDGRIEIEFRAREEGKTHAPWTGTGTIINVYDNVTDELVESFYIVIFGDLNGDSYITAADISLAEDEALGLTWWSSEDEVEYAPYMVKAADLSGNNKLITATDVAIVESASLGLYEIFQEDGSYEDYI